MKIIAVNISQNIETLPPKEAIERAWKLNRENCEGYDYVIGVANGNIKGYFQLNEVIQDEVHLNRVRFILEECTEEEIESINRKIETEDLGLRHFVHKYIS